MGMACILAVPLRPKSVAKSSDSKNNRYYYSAVVVLACCLFRTGSSDAAIRDLPIAFRAVGDAHQHGGKRSEIALRKWGREEEEGEGVIMYLHLLRPRLLPPEA
jgi:hypothetical protein